MGAVVIQISVYTHETAMSWRTQKGMNKVLAGQYSMGVQQRFHGFLCHTIRVSTHEIIICFLHDLFIPAAFFLLH
jgi:hypothetical protein